MKRVLAITFIFVFLIAYLLSVTTLVKADVVIGDNNNVVLDSTQYSLFKKLAVLSSLGDLTVNGVTEYTINDVSSVDDYIDYLINEIDSAIESNQDNIFNGISWVAVDEWNNYLNQKAYELAYQYQYPNVESDFLSDFFDLNISHKKEYKPNYSLNGFRGLSRFNNGPVRPNPDSNYQQYIDSINGRGAYQFFWYDFPNNLGNYTNTHYPATSYSYFSGGATGYNQFTYSNNGYTCKYITVADQILTLNINGSDNSYTGTIPSFTFHQNWLNYGNYRYGTLEITKNGNSYNWGISGNGNTNEYISQIAQRTGTLSDVLEWFRYRFKNINIYVNGVPWAIVSDLPSNPNIDIDGILKLYGNDNPVQYYIPNGTEIDYQKLYQVIYNAIINGTPVSQDVINNNNTYYYNNNYYSPTINNYYGSDDEDESDVLEDVLNIAIIPKFDTALLQPIEEPITNGTSIMILGVQSLPEDILFVIGAGFVLILFGAMINRLIE